MSANNASSHSYKLEYLSDRDMTNLELEMPEISKLKVLEDEETESRTLIFTDYESYKKAQKILDDNNK